ncbi:MAG: mechanosensitive ion channel [Proteobacteria bacterium]|nr:mechanosensitive ion channel [Pseudomonadota bacterium]
MTAPAGLPKISAMRSRPMIAALALGSMLVLLLVGGARAQPVPAGPPAVASPAEIDALVKTLDDPAARAKLVEQLRILAAAQQPATPLPGGPAGMVARFLADVSAGIAAIGGDLAAAALALQDLPRVGAWLDRQMRDPDLVGQWAILIAKLAAVLVAALLAEWLVERATRGARDQFDAARAADVAGEASLSLRWGGLAVRAVLGLVPILAFIAVAYLALAVVRPDPVTRLVVLAVIHANVLARAILAVARLALAQRDTRYRLLRLSEESAAYAYLWIRRLVAVVLYGFFLIEAGLLLGLPASAYNVALRVLGLVSATMVVLLILQNRLAVADWLRGDARNDAMPAPMRFGRRLADVWHILAILYVAAVYLVWALGVPGGFAYLSRATALTLLILALASVATALLRRAIGRGFAVGADLTQRLPGLEARANRYLPVLSAVLRGTLYLVAAVAVLESWGADSFGWLGSEVGRRTLSSLLTILVVLTVAAICWELLTAVIERYLGELDAGGTQPARSARTRTLLPLLRNASMILIIVMVGLIVLSEIGVDTAPLLAGAGVVGLAIGFGAQTLVKDVITGLFILIEDTINVGDVVQVDQRTGAVESISIRSIRIRDGEGAVHTVPFSAVSTVKNLTKDFSYYVFDIAVGQSADLGAVITLLRGIDDAMRADPAYQIDILEALDIQGVDKLVDGGLVMRARVKTRPGRQWTVGREFNRRIATELAAAGVPAPVPLRAVQMLGAAATPAAGGAAG